MHYFPPKFPSDEFYAWDQTIPMLSGARLSSKAHGGCGFACGTCPLGLVLRCQSDQGLLSDNLPVYGGLIRQSCDRRIAERRGMRSMGRRLGGIGGPEPWRFGADELNHELPRWREG